MKKVRFRTSGLKLAAVAILCAGALTGCGNSKSFVFTNTQGPQPIPVEAPIAVDDKATALGNATLQQAAENGVLVNDTVNGGGIISFDAVSAQGATVVLNDDGSFAYTPVFDFTGSDSFQYTLANETGESTATVTVNVDGRGLFVDNSQATNGNGSQASPFNNLAAALTAAEAGDTIFVYAGNGTATGQTGTFILPQGVKLIGQAQGLVAAQTIEPVGNRPVISGTIQPQGDNVIAGLEFNGTSFAIDAREVSNLTIQNNLFTELSDDNLKLYNIGESLVVTDNEFVGVGDGDSALVLVQQDTNATVAISENVFTDLDGLAPNRAIDISNGGNSVVEFTVSDNEFSGNRTLPEQAFEQVISVLAYGAADVTLHCTGNVLSNAADSYGIGVFSQGTHGIDATISGNTMDGGQVGLNYAWYTDVTDIFVVTIENNNISNIVEYDIEIEGYTVSATSKGVFFVRENTTTSTGIDASFALATYSQTSVCLDIFGNTFADDLALVSYGTSSLDVERLDEEDGGPLDKSGVNSVGGDFSANKYETGTITSRPAGYCQNQLP
ncbi:MAG: Ig-like domain-containing protein [Vulcanimicrobiota bacterium]